MVLPSPSWQEGILLILKAFRGLPPDIEDWHIKYWKELIDISKKIIENDSKRLL